MDVRGPSPLWVVPPLGPVVLCCVRKPDEQAMKNKPVSGTPPQSLFWFLLQGSHLVFLSEFPQWWSVTREPKDKISPFLCWVGSGLTTAAESKLGHYLAGRKFLFWLTVLEVSVSGNMFPLFWPVVAYTMYFGEKYITDAYPNCVG